MKNMLERSATRPGLQGSPGLPALLALWAAAALLLGACAQQTPPQDDPPPEPAVAVALDEAAVEVLRGASVEVEVAVTRVGDATEPARLTLEGALPAGVTAVFEPAEVSGNAGTSMLALTAEAEADEGALDFEVVVDAGELSASQPLSVTVTSLTVVGRVEDPFGRPVAGGRAGSQGQTVFVDSDGSFRLSGLSVPYDLMVGSGPAARLHVFEGLSEPSPVVVPLGGQVEPGGDGRATITGSVLAGDPLGTDEHVILCVEGHDVVVYFCGNAWPGYVDYEFDVVWDGDPGQAATLHAIHYLEGPDEEAIDFLGYDSFDIDLDAGATIDWDVDFEPVDSVALEGEVVRGAGITSGSLATVAAVRFGDNLSMVVNGSFNQPELSMLLPVLPAGSAEGTYDVYVHDGFHGTDAAFSWRSGVGPDAGVIALQDMPTLTGPGSGEVGVELSTPFGVVGLEGAVKTYVWAPESGSPGPTITLTTTRDLVTIPDPAELNLGRLIPNGQELHWGVNSSMAASVDEAAAEFREMARAVLASFSIGGAPEGAGDYLSPDGRTFVFGLPP